VVHGQAHGRVQESHATLAIHLPGPVAHPGEDLELAFAIQGPYEMPGRFGEVDHGFGLAIPGGGKGQAGEAAEQGFWCRAFLMARHGGVAGVGADFPAR